MTDDIAIPPLRDLPPGRLEARKEHLLTEIARIPERHGRSLPNWRPLAVVALAVTAAVVALSVFGSGGSPAGPSSAAAGVFNRLARVIAAQPLTPGPGQYLYIKFDSDWGAFSGNCETRSVEHDELWIGADGSGLEREVKDAGYFTSPADRAACLAAASNADEKAALEWSLKPRTSTDWSAPRCLELGPAGGWSSLSNPSSDPQTLLQQIVKLDGVSSTPWEEFTAVGDLLRMTDAPPAVRANIYRAAATIPGVESLGTVRDHAGRPGLGLAFDESSDRNSELIFDPQTGELMGEIVTGALAGWAVYLDEQVVDAVPGTPPEPLTPPCAKGGAGTVKQFPGNVTVATGAGVSSN